MTTREEIEAAAKRRILYHLLRSAIYTGGVNQREADGYTLADAYIAERSERQRRIEAAGAVIRHLSLAQGFITRLQAEQIITRCLDGETT